VNEVKVEKACGCKGGGWMRGKRNVRVRPRGFVDAGVYAQVHEWMIHMSARWATCKRCRKTWLYVRWCACVRVRVCVCVWGGGVSSRETMGATYDSCPHSVWT